MILPLDVELDRSRDIGEGKAQGGGLLALTASASAMPSRL